MDIVEKFIEKAKKNKRRVVFPEGEEERIVESAYKLKKEEIAEPVLVGNPDIIKEKFNSLSLSPEGIEIVDIEKSGYLDEFVKLYCERRKNVKLSIAARLVKKNLIFGGMMLVSGKVDLMVAGAVNTTASVIQAASLTVGYKEGILTPSSFFIMVLPDGKIYFYADCAVNIDPNSEQLADIGISTAGSFESLIGEKGKVAFLSFSTKGSASHPMVEKVQKAVEIAKRVARSTSNKRKLVRALIKEHKLKEKPLKMPEDKFNVIYADPPWKYDFSV